MSLLLYVRQFLLELLMLGRQFIKVEVISIHELLVCRYQDLKTKIAMSSF